MAITGALESAMAWMADNPESVIAAVITGIAGGVNLAGGVSNRKTRRSISRESEGSEGKQRADQQQRRRSWRAR